MALKNKTQDLITDDQDTPSENEKSVNTSLINQILDQARDTFEQTQDLQPENAVLVHQNAGLDDLIRRLTDGNQDLSQSINQRKESI